MHITTEGGEILGAQIGQFIGTSFFAATAVSLDSLLSSLIKDAILAFGFSPPGEELTVYMRMKYLVLAYAGTAIVIVNFWTMAIFFYRLIRIGFVPGLCLGVAVGMLLYWESNRNSRRIRDIAISVFFGFWLRGNLAVLYIWDRYEMLEGMVLFWLPRCISIPCEWIERRWLESEGIQRYEYSSCPVDENKNEIRLLRLKRRGIFSGLLEAELVSASIGDPPSYEAVSYCWGPTTEKKAILLNGKLFHCFPSAYALLYACSSLFKDRLLWVDAICINQDDLIERSKHVRIMRKIYENATRVIVWPGDSSSSRLASAMLYDLYGTSLMFQGSAYDFDKWFFHERYSPRWLALVQLLKKPYFSRIWVLQEIAVASNVQVLHGGIYIPWEIMFKIMTDLWHPHRRASLAYTSNPEMRTFHQSSQSDPAHNASIIWLLYEKHVGLAMETTPSLIAIDYEDTPAQVYIKSTRNILGRENDHFDILSNSGIGYRKKTDVADSLSTTLPSWVADWSSQRVGFTLASRGEGTGGYCSSTHTEITIDFLQYVPESSLEILSLKGILIDTIDELGCTLDTERESGEISISDYSTTVNLWYEEAKDITFRKAKNPYPQGNQSRAEALWRTIIGDTAYQIRPAPPEFGQYFSKWVEWGAIMQSAGTRSGLEDMMKKNDPQVEAMNSELSNETIQSGMRDYSNNLAEISVGRRFCVTKDGYMGLVPPGTEGGDLVCIIAGAPTPYLLRRFKHSSSKTFPMELYQLVGECYIHGRMDRVEILENDMRMLRLV
ncbi:hypothetical protein V500_02843 [Pseudogymnoascus sp. VKM F-4518 (FW-2643)]|nr:hypothetical protein V500_02843 [Pseudogymnoascus sp. VKM F-4518 (FW-2643)]